MSEQQTNQNKAVYRNVPGGSGQSILDELVTTYEPDTAPKITDAGSIWAQLRDIKDAGKEIFVAFYLTTKHQVIAREILSIGILDASIVHPREVFRGAILHNANSLILAHNHPSGDPTPSGNDIDVTKLMQQAGELLGITLLDHVIVGRNDYKSLKELGKF